MPKKKKNISKKGKKQEKIEEQEEKKEEISLEKKVEEEEIVESDIGEFREAITPIEIRAPVLERIQRPTPIREEISFQEQNQANQRERRVDYAIASNEPKYSTITNAVEQEEKKYETNFVAPVLTRRGTQSSREQEFLKPTDSLWMNNENPAWQSIEINSLEEQRGLPFENEQKKYRRFKLK